jgi:hypothetical protein
MKTYLVFCLPFFPVSHHEESDGHSRQSFLSVRATQGTSTWPPSSRGMSQGHAPRLLLGVPTTIRVESSLLGTPMDPLKSSFQCQVDPASEDVQEPPSWPREVLSKLHFQPPLHIKWRNQEGSHTARCQLLPAQGKQTTR